MPSLASGLMQGVTGFMQGRDRRREMDMEDERVQRDAAWRAEQMQMARDQMAAQREQQEAAQRRQEAEDARRMQMDRREAGDRGEVAVDDARRVGVEQMGMQGTNPMMTLGLKGLGAANVVASERPAYEIGGVGYTKTRPSLREQERASDLSARAAEMNAARIARGEERDSDRAWTNDRDKAQNALAMERDAANRASAERVARMQIAGRSAASIGDGVPRAGVEAVADNARTLAQIDEAIGILESGGGEGHIGARRRLLPNIVSQMTDPGGNAIRGLVAGIGSLQYKDLSGAAVSVSEDKRLQPSVPRADDTPDAALVKLRRLRGAIESVDQTVRGYYSPENGYRPLPPRPQQQTAAHGQRPPLSSIFGRP